MAKALRLPGALLELSRAAKSLGPTGGEHLSGLVAGRAGASIVTPGMGTGPSLLGVGPSPAGTAKTLA